MCERSGRVYYTKSNPLIEKHFMIFSYLKPWFDLSRIFVLFVWSCIVFKVLSLDSKAACEKYKMATESCLHLQRHKYQVANRRQRSLHDQQRTLMSYMEIPSFERTSNRATRYDISYKGMRKMQNKGRTLDSPCMLGKTGIIDCHYNDAHRSTLWLYLSCPMIVIFYRLL